MKRLLTIAALVFVVLVAGGAAADTFALHVVSQDTKTVTLGWDPQPGYGYLFSADGTVVSRTNDASRTTVKFSKIYTNYEVAVVVKGATGIFPVAPPNTSPTAPGNLRAANVTQTTITVVWDASTDDQAVANYRVYRDGTLIGQGPGSSGGLADQWADAGLKCDTSYVYGVEALDAQGNSSPRSTVSVKTAACDVVPPPTGNVVSFPATVTSTVFLQTINSAPAGAVTARPAAGLSSFTVTGDFTLNRQNVTIQHAVLRDVTVAAAGSGFVIEDSTIHSFQIDGASNWIIRRDTIAFNGVSYNGYGGSVMYRAKNWKILDSRITGAYVIANPSQHTEAWYIGAGNNGGLIQGNTFDDNGSTGHLFFTWWDQGGSGAQDPVNICVTNNSFTRSHNEYWHIDMRSELKWATNNIDIDPATNTWDKPYPYTQLVDVETSLRAC